MGLDERITLRKLYVSETKGPVAELREPGYLCEMQQECGSGDEVGVYTRNVEELKGDLKEMRPKMHIERPHIQENYELLQRVIPELEAMES